MTTGHKEDFLKRFGSKVAKLRQEAKISQEKLAALAGIHRTYQGRIERGESNPPIYTAYRIARALKVSVSELFQLSNLPPLI